MTLKELRERAGLRQIDVAKILDVDQGAISKWENGVNPPLSKYRKTLSKLYGCTENDLLKGGE